MTHKTITYKELLERIKKLDTKESFHFKRKYDLYGWGILKINLFWDTYLVLADYTEGSTQTIHLPKDYDSSDYLEDMIDAALQIHDEPLDGFYLITKEEAETMGFLCQEEPAPEQPVPVESKTYTFEVSGKRMSVTAQEVLAFYGPHYALTERDIRGYAGRYTAQIKYYGECDRRLDKALVQRLIEEERLMKTGEADSFKLQLTFAWYVELKKEGKEYLPFQYIVNAWCLDNAQTFTRKYTSLQAALLHCLNRFNENVSIPDHYESIGQYLNDPSSEQNHP